ncbi:autotransporter outer membrane beta-barrel domain-containing protein [Pantoea sp. B9002]|uniref:autotransporter family protein n=1 Tax=Pantoea sp. B9002 TaxID=2726979 RepID=UPI0015A20D21|nr:autotransporter outer membrane beta-barrel domain-containing protein [Pantoea sp. B9002]NWA63434.1 autotransporter outer membrane beta-barrel domain-containing protein [Pantoea sp. B9002]
MLVKTGAGTLNLSGNNSWNGGSRIEQGTLSFDNGVNLGSGTVELNGGTLLWQTGNTSDISDRLTVGSNGGIINDNGNDLTFNGGITGSGGMLVKQGSGALILTGDSSLNGTLVIDDGVVQIGNGGTSGSLLGDIVNNTQLILNRSDVLALTSNVGGSGALVQRGTGNSVVTGDLGHTGGTQIEAGNLQVGDGGTRGNLAGNVHIASGAGLQVNRSDATLLNGVISGEGRFEQMGSGTTVLGADNSWRGGTTITNGTLQVGNGGTSGSITGDVVNVGTLQFNRSDDITFSNAITGSGDVVQLGRGTLTLEGDQTYTGATRVENGTLRIQGSVQSDTTIAAAGTLTGEAKIFGSLTNSGTLRPGAVGAADYRAITVTGDYTGNDGVLALNSWLGADGSPTDQLILDGGHASGTTRVAITNTNRGEEYTYADGIQIIQAINGATTEDDAFRLAGDTRSGALSYRLFRGSLSGADTDSWYLRNQFIVGPVDPGKPVDPGEGGDIVEPVNPELPSEPGEDVDPTKPGRPGTSLPLTPPPAVLPPGEYPVIGPAVATYGVVQPVARELGMLTLGTLSQRGGDMALMINDAAQGPAMWTRLLVSEIDHSYQAFAAPTAKGTLGGLQIGADLWQGSFIEGHRERFGLYAAQTRANISVSGLVTNEAGTQYERQNTGKVKLTGTSLGGYWTHYGPGDSYLDATVQGTRYRGSAASESGSLETTGYGLVASLESGYPFALPSFGAGFTLEPQAQLIWQETRFKDSADRQSNVALGKTTGTTGRLGLRAKWSIETASGAVVEPFASVNYWQDWNGRSTTVYDGKDSAPLASSAGRISTEVGVGSGLTTNLKVYGALGYQMGASSSALKERESYSAGFGVRYSF